MSETLPYALKPTLRQTLSENIASSLRDAIIGGLIRPGQRLAEAQVASGLKVSRAPVRNALAALEQEGLVHRATNRGTTVVHLSRRDVDEITSLRLPLEVLAVRRLIAQGAGEHWAQLMANVQETEKADTPELLATLDLEFHELLVRSADHGRLLNSWLGLRSQVRLLMVRRNLTDPAAPGATVRGHKELLGAIRERNEHRAVQLVEKHLQKQSDWLIKTFGEVRTARNGTSGSGK
jgi:DNA-binding GntR family transcriptional regulator